MSRIYERSLIFIISKDEISSFEKYVNDQCDTNRLAVFKILNSTENCKVSLEVAQPVIVNKYSAQFIESIAHIERKDENRIQLEYCMLFARDVNDLFKNHIEIELCVLIDQRIQSDLDYSIIGTEFSKAVRIKMIYRIIDFQHYDLILYNMEELKIRVSNIESLNNEIELIKAVQLMKENIAAQTIDGKY